MNIAYIALGSNIQPRLSYLNLAVDQMNSHEDTKVIEKSAIYETEPVGYTNQNNFLNMVVEINTNLNPLELLHYCQQIEKKLGRNREIRWGPRTIDLDILLYNKESIELDHLIIPHPRMHERAFVLVPLSDVNPSVLIPTVNKSASAILDEMTEMDKKGVVKWVPMNGEEE